MTVDLRNLKIVERGSSAHYTFKVFYVLLTLFLEADDEGWTEEKLQARFEKLGHGAPTAYGALEYIADLEESGHVASAIEGVQIEVGKKVWRRIYRPVKMTISLLVEKLAPPTEKPPT